MLPHDADHHSRAGRGRRGGWRVMSVKVVYEAVSNSGIVGSGGDLGLVLLGRGQGLGETFHGHVAAGDQPVVVLLGKDGADQADRLVDLIIVPAIGRRPVKDVLRAEVEAMHNDHQPTPYQANRALAVLSKMMNWAEKRGLRQDGTNPCRHIERFPEAKRERFLSPRELARLGRALAVAERCGRATPWQAAAIRLLVFTGARLSEIMTARWEWFSPERSTLDLPTSKTGRRTIYLPSPALDVLAELPREKANPFVIIGAAPGMHLVNLSKLWRRLRKAALLPGVRLHDLRHSHASIAAAAGLSLPVIGALLGHTQAATTARYSHLAADPLKAASGLIAEQIAAAMQCPAKGEVVEMRRRRAETARRP
jgi:integrase